MLEVWSYFNYAFENAQQASINLCFIKNNCSKLGKKYKIRHRINKSEAYIQSNVINSDSHEINYELIVISVFLFLRRIELSQKLFG